MKESGRGISIVGRVVSLIGAGFSLLFLSGFMAIGLYLTYNTWIHLQWQSVPCKVQEFTIQDDPDQHRPFTLDVKYTYQWEGRSYTGTQVFRDKDERADYSDLVELRESFDQGKLNSCYVNPKNPSEASLKGTNLAMGLFGLIFAGGALFFIIIELKSRVKRQKSASLSDQAEYLDQNKESDSSVTPWIVCLAFALGGTFALFAMVSGYKTDRDSRSWTETTATVIWSKVTDPPGDSSPFPETFISYDVDGKEYRSTHNLRRIKGVSGEEEQVVEDYPTGTELICYVNPHDPYQAVLGFDEGWHWLGFLVVSLFPLIGWGGLAILLVLLVFELKYERGTLSRKKPPLQVGGRYMELAEEVTHTPLSNRLLLPLCLGIPAIVLSICVGMGVMTVIRGWVSGDPNLLMTAVVIPLTLITLYLLGKMIYEMMVFWSPMPVIKLKPGYCVQGEPTQLSWNIKVGAVGATELTIKVVGEEHAEYLKGTDVINETSRFYEEVLYQKSQLRFSEKGKAEITIPLEGTMPSLDLDNNGIYWSIIVSGAVENLPDFEDVYDVIVISPEQKLKP